MCIHLSVWWMCAAHCTHHLRATPDSTGLVCQSTTCRAACCKAHSLARSNDESQPLTSPSLTCHASALGGLALVELCMCAWWTAGAWAPHQGGIRCLGRPHQGAGGLLPKEWCVCRRCCARGRPQGSGVLLGGGQGCREACCRGEGGAGAWSPLEQPSWRPEGRCCLPAAGVRACGSAD